MANPPSELTASIEVGVQPVGDPDKVNEIDVALLPEGWKERVIRVEVEGSRGPCFGRCLEPSDLAASKLAAFRDKDRAFVRRLLAEGIVVESVVQDRIEHLLVDESRRRRRLQDWLRITAEELRIH